jgi:transposase
MKDFNQQPQKPRKKRTRKTEKYESLIKEWLIEDKNRHYKQRHTATRVYDRLKEMFEDFDVSYGSVATAYGRIRSEVYYTHKEYAPLRYLPGEAQCDMGICEFVENGIEYNGYYVVLSFPYSNIAFCQLLKFKNVQCILQGLKNIFEYIGGVPNQITFDNDSSIVNFLGEKITKRVENDLFLRFKNHYDFRVEYCPSHSPNQKGHVEGKVGYLRRNLFVPVPEMDNIDDYNRELLDKCTALHNRKHHRTKTNILELFECDKQAFLKLPSIPFEVATYIKRKVDRQGIVRFKGQRLYYLEPKYAGKFVQVKLTYNKISFYDNELNLITEFDRLYGNKNCVAVHWEDWLLTIAQKPNSLFHSGLVDMFSERLKEYLLNGTAKLRSLYMRALNELIKTTTLKNALVIEDVAASKSLIEIDDILALAAQ